MDRKGRMETSSDSITHHVQKLVEVGSKVSESQMNFQLYSDGGVNEIPITIFVVRDPDVAKKISKLLEEL